MPRGFTKGFLIALAITAAFALIIAGMLMITRAAMAVERGWWHDYTDTYNLPSRRPNDNYVADSDARMCSDIAFDVSDDDQEIYDNEIEVCLQRNQAGRIIRDEKR